MLKIDKEAQYAAYKALLATMPAKTKFTKNEREIIVRTAQQKRAHCFARQYERLKLIKLPC